MHAGKLISPTVILHLNGKMWENRGRHGFGGKAKGHKNNGKFGQDHHQIKP